LAELVSPFFEVEMREEEAAEADDVVEEASDFEHPNKEISKNGGFLI
jgi:hypothetical protein